MTHVIVVAHAPLASAMKAVAEHVYPDCAAQLRALDVEAGATGDQAEAALRNMVLELPGTDVLILADAFGATPCNAALRVADGVRVKVVSGLNVPMLWRTLCYAAEPVDRLVTRAVDGGAQGVLQVSAPRRQNQQAGVGTHAQVVDSSQQ